MRFVRFDSYVIPTYGNRHSEPYGRMLVEHNGVFRSVRFGEVDMQGRSFITFDRKQFFFRNDGSLYSPHIVFDMDEPAPQASASESRAEKTMAAHLEWLLNVVVDDMVTKAGNQNLPVIQWLTENGFTEHDMTCTLGFPLSEVRAVLAADMGDQ